MVIHVDNVRLATDTSPYLVIAYGPFFALYLEIVRQAYGINRRICTHPHRTKVLYGRTLVDTGATIRASRNMPGWNAIVRESDNSATSLASHVVDMNGHATLVVLDCIQQSVEIYDPLCQSPTDRVRRFYHEKLTSDLGDEWTLSFTSDNVPCPGLQDSQQQYMETENVEFYDGTNVKQSNDAWRTMLCMFWVLYMLTMKARSPKVPMSALVRVYMSSVRESESQLRILSFADRLSRVAVNVTGCTQRQIFLCAWKSFNQLSADVVALRVQRALQTHFPASSPDIITMVNPT
jgi:hypothetical protein